MFFLINYIFFSIEGNYTLKGTMHGSNAGIMSVQIDPQVRSLLLASVTRRHVTYKDNMSHIRRTALRLFRSGSIIQDSPASKELMNLLKVS